MNTIMIHDVCLRDGLQAEQLVVPLEQKIRWAECLMTAGIDIIQLGSFVHPEKVPQMADTDAMFRYFNNPEHRPKNVILSGLVLNEKGLERGEACGVEMYCMGVSASDTHSRKNSGMSTHEATERIIAAAAQAVRAGKRVQLSVQSAFGCGYEGLIPQERVLGIIRKYVEAGFKTLSLADTAGHAYPEQVTRMFEAVFNIDPAIECTCHFHNTYGLGLANCYAAMNAGVKYFEASTGGLGGCPFTKLPSGNVPTEDLVHSLQRAGNRTDIHTHMLIVVAKELSAFFHRELPGLVYKSGLLSDHLKKEPL